MSFLKKILGGGSGDKGADSDANAMWLYVRCNKCGAPVAIRVDMRNDISTDYETGARFLRKEIMDGTCFQLMYANVKFDSAGKINDKSIERGTFLTREEYETARAEFDAARGK
ncbi:MAG: hypothetical protein IT331_01685 [Anaerolineae bacterium]|nr:hypothetical protein [Anaerolineae bacterium]